MAFKFSGYFFSIHFNLKDALIKDVRGTVSGFGKRM
jgi:hypothetical protein